MAMNYSPYYPMGYPGYPQTTATNSGRNISYNSFYPAATPSQGVPSPTPASNITWVQGIEGAKAFAMSPNTTMVLLDSEIENRFYIKTCDAIGMTALRMFDFVEHVDEPVAAMPAIDLSQYVTRGELEEMIKEIKDNEQFIPTAESARAKPKRNK